MQITNHLTLISLPVLMCLGQSAWADLIVRFDPADTTVVQWDIFDINIVADISDPVLGWGLDLAFDDFHSVWNTKEITPNPLFEKGTEKAEPGLLIQRTLIKLQLIFETCIKALLSTLHHFKRKFDLSLTEKQDHKADVGFHLELLLQPVPLLLAKDRGRGVDLGHVSQDAWPKCEAV